MNKLKILFVDDEPLMHSVVERCLRGHFRIICHVNDGKQALEALETNDFDIIISDVDMPRMDGVEFYNAITEDQRNRFIFFTSDPSRIPKSMRGEFVVSKPMKEPDDLIWAVRRMNGQV